MALLEGACSSLSGTCIKVAKVAVNPKTNMKRKFSFYKGPVQLPTRKKVNTMAANPQSIPEGWDKDTPTTESQHSGELPYFRSVDEVSDFLAEGTAQDAAQDVPRSATGVVNEAGEIVDDSGNTVGKLAESQDPKELVGNTVNETGDVVSSAGDVLGKASLDNVTGGDYTTEAQDDQQEGQQKQGWFGKAAKGVSSTLGSFGGRSNAGSQKAESNAGVEDTPGTDDVQGAADQAKSGAEETADDAQKQGEEATEEAKDKAEDTTDEAKAGAEGTADDAQKQADETTEGAKDGAEETAEDVQKQGEETAEDAQNKGEEVGEDAQKQGEEATDEAKAQCQDAQKQGEEATDEAKAQCQDAQKQGEDVAEEGQDKAEDATDQAKDKAEDATDEAKDKTDEGGIALEDKEGEQAEGEDAEKKEGEEGEEGEQVDYTVLENGTVNKAGNIVSEAGKVVGRLVEGDAKQLQGKKVDKDGNVWNESGKIVGKGEPLSESERGSSKDYAPFENFPDAVVEGDGSVTSDGKRVGTVVEGDAKRLKGSKVDEDGDILDRNGNVVGKAEAWDEPEEVQEEEPDRSILAGKRVNKAGNVVDQNGAIFGKVVEGNVSSMNGRMCDKNGNIMSESGDVLGKAEVVPEGEREGSKEGPFADLEGLTVAKDGKVVTASGDVVGRLTSGDPKTLFGRSVDQDGDVVDKNGNVLAKAERWEEPEEEKKQGPMAGRKVNREGNVVDEDGNIIGKLTSGDITTCAGKEIDDDGDVINSKGNTVGHVALLEDIPPEPEPEETEEQKKEREQAENDKKLAAQLGYSIEQSLDKIKPILKMITNKIDNAERQPKEELDEEQLVKEVKPLIEEGGKILTETNGIIRGMDPDGRIQRNAKHKSSTKEASPEEHHLAEQLKEVSHIDALEVNSQANLTSSPVVSLKLSTTPSARSRVCLTPRRSSTLSGVFSWSLWDRSLLPSVSCLTVFSALSADC